MKRAKTPVAKAPAQQMIVVLRPVDPVYQETLDPLGVDVESVRTAGNSSEVLMLLDGEVPDLLLLCCDGMHTGRTIADVRREWPELPLIVLTRSNSPEVHIRYFDLGADDVVQLPASPEMIRARRHSLLRRTRLRDMRMRVADVVLDRLSHSVTRDGTSIFLSRREFHLFEYLLLHRGRCVTRDELLAKVWKGGSTAAANVDVYINYLRRKLNDPCPGFLIQTVYGRGYFVRADAN